MQENLLEKIVELSKSDKPNIRKIDEALKKMPDNIPLSAKETLKTIVRDNVPHAIGKYVADCYDKKSPVSYHLTSLLKEILNEYSGNDHDCFLIIDIVRKAHFLLIRYPIVKVCTTPGLLDDAERIISNPESSILDLYNGYSLAEDIRVWKMDLSTQILSEEADDFYSKLLLGQLTYLYVNRVNDVAEFVNSGHENAFSSKEHFYYFNKIIRGITLDIIPGLISDEKEIAMWEDIEKKCYAQAY
ncbi:MAG: hypothetical protein LBL47_04490 [Lactobacillus sp.]|jgi:hypothetical protein|nr:hypothetical protein [Lactobacillus sp.]